jgi:hypothetical protein
MNAALIVLIVDTLVVSPKFSRKLPELKLEAKEQIALVSNTKKPEMCTTKVCEDVHTEQFIKLN